MRALPLLLVVTAAAGVVNSLFYGRPLGRLLARLQPRATSSDGGAGVPAPEAAPAVSVVIAARNEARNLASHLPQVLAQAYPGECEVIVVDDASTDDTAAVLARLARSHPRLRVVDGGEKSQPGKKAALARGIAVARHDSIVVTDADCRPASTHWLSGLVAARAPGIEIVLGVAPLTTGDARSPDTAARALGAWARFEAAYTAMQYLSAALAGRAYMGVGRNLLYRRSAYTRVGGFAEHAGIAGGDDDLFVNAAARGADVAVCVAPATWVYSAAEPTWRAYLRQKRRHLGVSTHYKVSDQVWLATLAGSHAAFYLGLGALLTARHPYAAAWLYVGRGLVVAPRAMRAMRGLGVGDLCWAWPLLDAGIGVYYAFAATALRVGAPSGWRAESGR